MKNSRPTYEEAKACAGSDIRYALLLSIYYHLGNGTAIDRVASEDWFDRASSLEDADYLCYLGELREQGCVVAKDFVAANKAYIRARRLDELKGTYMLARLASNPAPDNPFKNVYSTVRYLARATALGHIPSALLLLRVRLHSGQRLRALLQIPGVGVKAATAVFSHDARRLWRYADVFRRTEAIAKYVGKDRMFSAPRTLDEIDVEQLGPPTAASGEQTQT